MGLLRQSAIGAIIRFIIQTIIATVCLMLQFNPPQFIIGLIGAPPPWLVSPLARALIVVAGVLIIILIQTWDDLFSDPLTKAHKRIAKRAIESLQAHPDQQHMIWLRENFAAGVPPDETGKVLVQLLLVTRDSTTGWSEIRPDLKLFVAKELERIDSFWSKLVGWLKQARSSPPVDP